MHLSFLQLQLNENFDVSYFAADHAWHRKHWDSGFGGPNELPDTGLKVNILLIINNDKEINSKYGKLRLFYESP